MVDIFQEVEEELRAERMRRIAVRYGSGALAAVLLIVGGTGAWQGWRWWQGKQDARFSEAYVRALESVPRQPAGEPTRPSDAAVAAFDRLANDAPQGYAALAGLNAAALRADADQAGSLENWDRVAGNQKASQDLRQLATLLWAAHQIDHGDPGQVRSRLEPLVAAGSPWTALAKEQLALLELREDRIDKARSDLKALSGSPVLPAGLNGRAASLMAKLGG